MFNKLHNTAANSETRLPRFKATPNAITAAKIPRGLKKFGTMSNKTWDLIVTFMCASNAFIYLSLASFCLPNPKIIRADCNISLNIPRAIFAVEVFIFPSL